ncbi:uncharacterized protein LOC141901814 isoform X2 [Tubulanus polymorphus]
MAKALSITKTAGQTKAKQLKVKALKAGMVTKSSIPKKRKIIPTTKAKGTNIINSIAKRVPMNKLAGLLPEKTKKAIAKVKKDTVKNNVVVNTNLESHVKEEVTTDVEQVTSASVDDLQSLNNSNNNLDSVDGSFISIEETSSEAEDVGDHKKISDNNASSISGNKPSAKSFAQKRALKDNRARYKLNPAALRELTRLVADEKGNADALKQINKLASSTKSGCVSLKALTELVTKEAELKERTRKRKREANAAAALAAKKSKPAMATARKKKPAATVGSSAKKQLTGQAQKQKSSPPKSTARKKDVAQDAKSKKKKSPSSAAFQQSNHDRTTALKLGMPKTEVVKPVPRTTHAKTGPSMMHIPTPTEFSAFKTPATTPATIVHQPQILVLDNDATAAYYSDLPTCTLPVAPIFPSSPTTESYRSLVMNLPAKLQANRLVRRRNSKEEDEEIIQRRLSVRQSESAFKYKEIVVKKFDSYTQIWLFTNTKLGNSLNPQVFQELISAFNNAKYDESSLVMLSGTGSLFCSGIDLAYLINSENRKKAAEKMAATLRDFIQTLIAFPKPVVAAVNGPAIGLGATILPLCDVVYASDKASFYLPYARIAQTPEGCSSFTLPSTIGMAMANEMLFGGRKLTAMEAYQSSLVSQVFWPTTMMQEVVPRVQQMASQSARALEATKLMIRSHIKAKLDYTNDSECNMLKDCWLTSEFYTAAKIYVEEEQHFL